MDQLLKKILEAPGIPGYESEIAKIMQVELKKVCGNAEIDSFGNVIAKKVSCIHPMFHLNPNPKPPDEVSRVTPDHAVDSSAIIMTPGCVRYEVEVASCKSATASRFSRPPCMFGNHWPSSRE